MTLAEIKTAAAAILNVAESAFTIGGIDMFLVAVNQVRRDAEQNWDFEFQRRLVQVSVDPVTGGSLSGAVLRSDGTTAVKVKTVLDMGEFDDQNNLRPVEWTSVGEGLERQRADTPWRYGPRYPTDGQARCAPYGGLRYEVINDTIFRWPKNDTISDDIVVGLEVYAYQDDWASVGTSGVVVSGTLSPSDAAGAFTLNGTLNGANLFLRVTTGSDETTSYILYRKDALTGWVISVFQSFAAAGGQADKWSLTTSSTSPVGSYTAGGANTGTAVVANSSVSDLWTEHAHQYLLWASVVHLNYITKTFVPRTEGNLPPPTQMAQAGLESFKLWDEEKFGKFRRHGR